MRFWLPVILLCLLVTAPCFALDQPWISTTYFYWYSWDYQKQWGSWTGEGVYLQPLRGYYDSASYADNLFGIRQSADWGVTHHFMDYWGPGWRGEDGNPREDILMRATEDARKEGYNIWMSTYQDGDDFDMKQFSANLDEGRDTDFYIRRFAKNPALPLVNGKPAYMIYGRNGVPQITGTDEGFRSWLVQKFGSLDVVNQRWGSDYGNFTAIKFNLNLRGRERADAASYQFHLWEQEMARVNERAQSQYNLPGVLFSWDVGFTPFLNMGYANQQRVFAGPHSYGGIFDVPHAQGVERFINSALAKRYNTIFMDTFKNYYHDWEIRIPGIAYPPDFNAFDRFWVQSLSNYSEALLHLSWNEWWEGSNLEPSYEFGKTYCEKNLLYSSIMQECFDSIKEWNRGATVAVLLNDYNWMANGRHGDEVLACIQALRRNNIKFDLLADDFVTAEELAKFNAILAPAAGIGFGENALGQPIENLLFDWAQIEHHKLMISDWAGITSHLVLPAADDTSDEAAPAGPDMNLYVDIGEEGDTKYLVSGSTWPEDWAKLGAEDFGATDRKYTVRWTPGVGDTTSFMVPFSPNRDHVLRLAGSSMWGNKITVMIEGRPATTIEYDADEVNVEAVIPAAAIGNLSFGELTLRYDHATIPTEIDPVKWPSENRVCNLALDWLQLATTGTEFNTVSTATLPEASVAFQRDGLKTMGTKTVSVPFAQHRRIADSGKVLSRYGVDNVPRDLTLDNGILYCNGLFSDISDTSYLDSLLRDWAGCKPELEVTAKDIIATRLNKGQTDIILAYNYAAPEARDFELTLGNERDSLPIQEVQVLSRDGFLLPYAFIDLNAPRRKQPTLQDRFDYYAVYQIARGRVGLKPADYAIATGATANLTLELVGATPAARGTIYEGTVRMISPVPSLTSETMKFSAPAGKAVKIQFPVTASDTIDWGRKTVIFDVQVGERHTYYWRRLQVLRKPDLQIANTVIDGNSREALVAMKPFPWAQDAPAQNVKLTTAAGETFMLGNLQPGGKLGAKLGRTTAAGSPELVSTPAKIEWEIGGKPQSAEVSINIAEYGDTFPMVQDAVAPLIACNGQDAYLEHVLLETRIKLPLLKKLPAYVRDNTGQIVPSQLVGDRLFWIGMLPARSARLYYLCAGNAPQPTTDLHVGAAGGTASAGNSRFELGWNAAQGGTVSRLVSHITGYNYGASTFGAGIGNWGKFDPRAPVTDAVKFVSQESRQWQRDLSNATISVIASGPVVGIVQVSATDGVTTYTQEYTIGAFQDGFEVKSSVETKRDQPEIVALDVRLKRNDLRKIYPNFTGISLSADLDNIPHDGFRECSYIAPVATFLTPDAFRESLSVFPLASEKDGPNWYRQGWWPQQRPTPGAIEYGEIELCRRDDRRANASAYIAFHSGHQTEAYKLRDNLVTQTPTVLTPKKFRWSEALPTPAVQAAGWWSPFWHYAIPVTVGPLTENDKNALLIMKPDFASLMKTGEQFDTASPRAVVSKPLGATLLQTVTNPETGELVVTLNDSAFDVPPTEARTFMLYFDSLQNGAKHQLIPTGGFLSSQFVNGGFENDITPWIRQGCSWVEGEAHTGTGSIKLEILEGVAPVVVTNSAMRTFPDTRYIVRFYARTSTPGAAIHSNFHEGAVYDFPQFEVPLIADGQWHAYQMQIPTGSFPAGVNPAFRLWVIGQPQTVFVDDVEVEPMSVPETPQVPFTLGTPVVY